MNDRALDRLIHDVLDGAASAGEESKLEAHTAANPAVRARYEDAKSMFEMLGQVKMEKSPAGLTAAIERDLERASSPRQASRSPLAGLDALFRRRPVPAFAFAFVAGLAIGAIAWAGVSGNLAGSAYRDLPVMGSMTGTATPVGTIIESRRMAAGSAQIHVETRAVEGGIFAAIATQSADPLEVRFTFDESAWRLIDLRWSRPEVGSVRREAGKIVFEQRGQIRYALQFEGAGTGDPAFRISARSSDGSVEEVIGSYPGGRVEAP